MAHQINQSWKMRRVRQEVTYNVEYRFGNSESYITFRHNDTDKYLIEMHITDIGGILQVILVGKIKFILAEIERRFKILITLK